MKEVFLIKNKILEVINRTLELSMKGYKHLLRLSWRRKAIFSGGLLFFWYSLVPFTFRQSYFNVGSLQLMAIGLFLIAVSLLGRSFKTSKRKIIRNSYRIVFWIGNSYLIIVGIISIFMLAGAMNVPPQDSDVTVVVLGCQVIGDRPTMMLRSRLESAADYLERNPTAKCVVTGGVGSKSTMSEAAVSKNWLIEWGIDSDRIYVEDKSTNTLQNLSNTYDIIKANGLSEKIVIVTDSFHQLRASYTAEFAGFSDVYACSSRTRWYFIGHYWMRDIGGIGLIWLMGDKAYDLETSLSGIER